MLAFVFSKAQAMYTIVAASQKGGSGKTTLSGHLAVEASRAGAGEIALIDTDPQGSLAAWWNARDSDAPQFVKAGVPRLETAFEGLRPAGVQNPGVHNPPPLHPPPFH